MRVWYVVAAVLMGALLAGAVVACGGDDDPAIVPITTQTQESEALSQSEFISEVDDICEEANIAVANLAANEATDTSSQAASELNIVEGELDQIQDLEAPSEDSSTLNDFIDALEDLIANLESQELAEERGDTAGLSELQAEATTIRGELLSAGDEYGFKECGQEGEATTTGTDTGTETPVAPAPTDVPAAPVTPEPAPAPDTGGTGTDTGGTGTDTGGTGGTGGVAP